MQIKIKKTISIVSLDNEKAFDREERNFIEKSLIKFTFPPNFIQWFNIICKKPFLK